MTQEVQWPVNKFSAADKIDSNTTWPVPHGQWGHWPVGYGKTLASNSSLVAMCAHLLLDIDTLASLLHYHCVLYRDRWSGKTGRTGKTGSSVLSDDIGRLRRNGCAGGASGAGGGGCDKCAL